MTSPKFSIVIPSLNKGKHVGETLKSIFDQNYRNLEVIIQDGGSTDNTIEIVKIFSDLYPGTIKWETNKDNGQLDAINKGFTKSRGDILAFINPDDLYDKGVFGYVEDAYKKHPNSLWFVGYGKIINKKGQEVAQIWSWIKNLLLDINSYFLLLATANYIVEPSVFVTKKAFRKYGPLTGMGGYVFEYELWLRLGRVSMPVIIHKNLSKFRIGGINMKSLFREKVFKKDLEIAKKYSKNNFIVFLHWLNNSIRLLVNKHI